MDENPDDICPRPDVMPPQPTQPLAPPLYTSAVYRCQDIEQAEALMGGQTPGYIYVRDGNPNADLLAEKCRQLHGAERAAICASGMAALAAGVLSQVAAGDRVLVSNQLYGRTAILLIDECGRLGIESEVVDVCDLEQTRAALRAKTRLVVCETITNPLLRTPDLAALAEATHAAGALLMVDNTFAGPAVCRPLSLGADIVMESLTKTMGGHSDVCLGLLCGSERDWARVPTVLTTWGLASSPFDCWLAARGLSTMALRVRRANETALEAARFLAGQPRLQAIYYPGLPDHPDHAIAARQFGGQFGTVITFTLAGGRSAADAFIANARSIPFSPSLGDLSTTLSHPESTSHRGMAPEARARLGITAGTIRLSVGIESPESIIAALAEGLAGIR